MPTIEKVRPIYGELIGYLSQIPLAEKSNFLYEPDTKIAEYINITIDELSGVTGQDFSKFKTETEYYDDGYSKGNQVSVMELRTKLNGLIMRIYATYFSEENPPFGGNPNIVVNQSQNQNQSQVSMLLEFQGLIDKKLNNPNIKEEEKKFLQKVRSTLPSIKSATELFSTAISIAKDFGLNMDTVHQLLK